MAVERFAPKIRSEFPMFMTERGTQQGAAILVAAAAIFNERGEVLISKRPAHLHQGGLWEFPGGKVEPGEDSRQALARELWEELGIEVQSARPLIRIHHDYPDRRVVLDVWRVNSFHGRPRGQEGQMLAWVSPEALPERAFPEANLAIVSAVRLPTYYLITPEPDADLDVFLARLESSVGHDVRLVQLRANTLDSQAYRRLAERVLDILRPLGVRLLLNRECSLVEPMSADGVHLNSARLRQLARRPLASARWVAASCHSAEELAHAQRIGVDFVVLSPLRATASHPGAIPLGWERFAELTERAGMPVFALGGMESADLQRVFRCGAQGIAAIRHLWRGRRVAVT